MKLADITEYEEYGNKKKNVTVSIWCLTYNHVDYIKKAFEGFLSQKTNFDIEVLVYDDASTDGTSDIVREYAIKYPDVFHAFISKTNLYSHPDRKKALLNLRRENLTGKYLAFCEGDDYWIYDYKLQRQYDYMEMHPETSMCVHNAVRVNEELREYMPHFWDYDSQNMSYEEIFFSESGNVPTASFFLRREVYCSIPKSYRLSPVGDDPLKWWCAICGNVYYMNKIWSVRNYMHHNSWSFLIMCNSENYKNHCIMFAKFITEFKKEIKSLYGRKLSREVISKLERKETSYYYSFIKDLIIEEMSVEKKKGVLSKALLQSNVKLDEVIVKWLNYELYKNSKNYCKLLIDNCRNLTHPIYVYGAGLEAAKTLRILESKGILVSGFVVTCGANNPKKYEGKKVFQFTEVENLCNSSFALGLNLYNRREVFCMLFEYGISNFL